MNINTLFDTALKELDNLNIGERFTLKDLFKGYEWNRIEQGDRRTLGTLFLTHAKSNEQIKVEKTSSGQKIYSLKHK